MKNKKILLGVGSLLVMAFVLVGSLGMVAQANDDQKSNDNKWYGEHKLEANKKGSTLEVNIGNDGKVLVRGAKVTSVTGSTIMALTEWNGASLSWTVNTDANSKFIKRSGGASNISEVKAGDFVSFSGSLMAGTTFTVQAKHIKNWSSVAVVKQGKTTLEGKIVSIAGTTLPNTFVMKSGDTNYTVRVATNTSVLNTLWLRSSLVSFATGDSVRVYGVVNTDNTIDATVVRDTNIR